MDTYITYDSAGDFTVQVLDAEAAVSSGISKENVALAAEMIAYQNQFMAYAFHHDRPTAGEYPLPQLTDFAKASDFAERAAEKAAKNAPIRQGILGGRLDSIGVGLLDFLGATSVFADNPYLTGHIERRDFRRACGTFRNPVPRRLNPRVPVNDGRGRTARRYFRDNGFHLTHSYATYAHGYDYTYNRSFRNFARNYTCPSPTFRNHGTVAPSNAYAYKIQYGEPNPEIRHYVWPVWEWGIYVLLWHDRDNNFPPAPHPGLP